MAASICTSQDEDRRLPKNQKGKRELAVVIRELGGKVFGASKEGFLMCVLHPQFYIFSSRFSPACRRPRRKAR
jgi:hypothetical protein